MKTSHRILMLTLALALTAVLAGPASATEEPANAAVFERVFNDCPTSILTVVNSYPTEISIEDQKNFCGGGFANRHAWRFSDDGATAYEFMNANGFSFSATMVISGGGEAEAGLQISPWWSPLVDGSFNVRSTDGEIACFGGRLPFYSFTGNHGLNYAKGMPITLEIIYLPNGLEELDPATIEYVVTYDGVTYNSGPLGFDMGNPDEDPPYGLWGILNQATAGGHMQVLLQEGADDAATMVVWSDIDFVDLGDAVAVEGHTWSNVKSLFN